MATIQSTAQQLPQYTLIQLNPYYLNPAAAGMNNTLEITARYRNQWNNLPGSPTQYLLTGNLPIYSMNSSIGFLYESDNIGAESLNRIGGSVGYVLKTRLGLFSISSRVIYEQLQFKGSELRTGEGNYEGTLIDHNDPSLPITDVSRSAVRIDAGLWMKNKSFSIGVNYNNLYHSGFYLIGVENYVPSGVLSVYGEYFIRLTDEFIISPALIIESDFIHLQSLLSISMKYKGLYFIGSELTGYSPGSIDQLGVHAGFRLNKNFIFVYQYGVGLSRLSAVHSGTHEIGIKYSLGKPVGGTVLPKIIYNPRYVE